MILGFDISTRCIGWCLVEDDGTFIKKGYIDFLDCYDFYDKAKWFSREVLNNFHFNWDDVKKIYVEEPVKMFAANQSSAHVISLLQRFNATCCWILYCFFDIKPIHIMEASARKLVGIKVPKGVKKKEKKQFVFEFVKNLKDIPDEWEYKRTGNPKDWCYDTADAVVVAKAGVIKNG